MSQKAEQVDPNAGLQKKVYFLRMCNKNQNSTEQDRTKQTWRNKSDKNKQIYTNQDKGPIKDWLENRDFKKN